MTDRRLAPSRPFPAGRGEPALPVLDGEMSTTDADLTAAATDFGNYVHDRPRAVVRPGSVRDVAAMIRFAAARGLPVAARGAGHSVDGQAQVPGGIVLDLGALTGVTVAGDRLTAAAGTRWRELVRAALAGGRIPPVLPDYLGLTVGGTVAAGGVGGGSHRRGGISDNVLGLRVATPDGRLVTCSPRHEAALFDAVRGTQGEYGVIVEVTLRLVRAPELVHVERRTLGGAADLLAAQVQAGRRGSVEHVLGQAVRSEDGSWAYLLETAAVTGPGEPVPLRDFVHRLDAAEQALRATGSWQHDHHPRGNVLLPGAGAARFIQDTLGGLEPRLLGPGGTVLIYPIPTRLLAAPHAPKAADPLTVVFGIQRTAPAGDSAMLDRMRRANEELRIAAIASGGAAYSARTPFHHARARDPGRR